MLRSFDIRAHVRDRRMMVRAGLGGLLAANLAAAVFVFHPLGGSAADLAEEVRTKQLELTQYSQRLDHTRNVVSKVQQAKTEGDQFLEECTMHRRSAFSGLIGEINQLAVQSGMQPKQQSYTLEPVKGSETLEQLTISADYQGSYQSLTKFVNLLDKSKRFLIISGMQAAPQTNGSLNVNIRLDTFIRDTTGGKS